MSMNFFDSKEHQLIELKIEKIFFYLIYKKLSAAEQFYPRF